MLAITLWAFTITNNCTYTIWPGTLAGAGTPQLLTTGFQLDSGQSVRISSVPGWSGRIWARTGCTFDRFGVGSCQTGDCGGRLECDGNGATPPASLFEITLGNGHEKDFYDVSIVDGYNLALVVQPRGVYSACDATGCASDINMGCQKELQVVGGEAGRGERVMLVKVRVKHLGWINTVVAGSLLIQLHVDPHFIRPFSSELVQELTATPMTMARALSHARHMIMTLYSVLILAGMDSFLHSISFGCVHSLTI